MQRSLAVLDSSYGDVVLEAEAAAAHGVTVRDARENTSPADGVLVQYATIGAAEMDANPSWKVIGRYGVGVDTIDLEAAASRGIPVVNVPDYCEEEVATHAAALILGAARRIREADLLVRDGAWGSWSELRPIQALSQSTLSLIGIGHIGSETIRLMSPFFGRIVAHDPFAAPADGVELLGFEEALAAGDVISLHCPLNDQTRHLIDAAALAHVKPGAVLVNVSRGGLINSADLAAALHDGRLAGAALDVLEAEPPAGDPILDAPRVTLTNHIAWYSEQSERRLRHLLAERCAGVLDGKPAPTVANRAALERLASN
ncbi:C-terminal binding protein [Salinibacterium sp. NSLL150]|uniref:C-terminal binding protein n=1 Tax=unclassified Salinibacterium TaxID=2632331 RepID=UPI0018CDA2B6|nr:MULTISPECIES: C-terminal binding protein [unclassified Salinibacterium]MBH0097527.1 C-terminal binding protein [Salinibacterium sp. NSLL35]MBH0100282.1 C-terminal binding protein [Salinibacterium sp. NSLL150]MBH0103041.1 C-terminal binding protein [Salinibacterium sp. NSLL16]MBH0105802.1 C-terminal binding protein [Salinibacterium sp. NSLL17]MBH0110419.1 C-terminal binding protein [Salinibacterium sp. NG22]